MKSLDYYKYQLEYFTKLREKCTNKETLTKLERVISRYQHLVDNDDHINQSKYEEEEVCHCPTCMMG